MKLKQLRILAAHYKMFRTHENMIEDIRLIRRSNMLLDRFQKTQQIRYLKEVENIISIINNLFILNSITVPIIMLLIKQDESKKLFLTLLKKYEI